MCLHHRPCRTRGGGMFLTLSPQGVRGLDMITTMIISSKLGPRDGDGGR